MQQRLIIAIAALVPGAQFAVPEDAATVAEVEWFDERPMPTQADVDAHCAAATATRRLQRARDVRKPILDALAGIGFDAMAAGDGATTAAVRSARQGLLDITKQADVVAATAESVSDDDFDAVVLQHYHALVAEAPDVVRNAFRDTAT